MCGNTSSPYPSYLCRIASNLLPSNSYSISQWRVSGGSMWVNQDEDVGEAFECLELVFLYIIFIYFFYLELILSLRSGKKFPETQKKLTEKNGREINWCFSGERGGGSTTKLMPVDLWLWTCGNELLFLYWVLPIMWYHTSHNLISSQLETHILNKDKKKNHGSLLGFQVKISMTHLQCVWKNPLPLKLGKT